MSTDTITKSTVARSVPRGTWQIDPTRSRVEFHTPTLWGRAMVRGHFECYEGILNLERSPAIELTIDAASINTNVALRDRHLRSADFFDVANHPEVRFVSDTATLRGETLSVRGHLYAAGRSIPLEFEARLRHVGKELEVEAATNADHLALGMSHGTLGMIRTPSELIVHGRLVQ